MAQKYNVGKSVAQSKTGQTAGDLITVLSDVAPVIQGLTDYLAGQRKKLEDEDRAYLDAIKSAQSGGDFSDLFADDMMSFGEEVVEEPVVTEPVGKFRHESKLKILWSKFTRQLGHNTRH